ncbi:LysR family transcriptional regulator [Novosphingobium sp. PP1Y]|uniref:LysR family transcriptional regulator n=1 Tax=Novosphingobium sp. PP1Y TaxID=702113 RepID=UPI00020EFB61|nr:LysR family transcriptional regulator [Novosphingobium sp. PP1Y]CCA90384.1 LysR family transcriptional regulator [Novosphingobium sp. PP1Y]
MRFKGLDLNLLLVLETLLAERSVTAASRRLNLSQPATSAALAKLREYFNDELLQQRGRTMFPTAHALSIRPLVREVLADAERLIATSASFDPATSDRKFVVMGSDYIFTTLLASFIASLQAEAPNIRIQANPLEPNVIKQLERAEVDLLLTPRHFVTPEHPAIAIFEEQHVIVGWNENPIFSKEVKLEDFLAAPQVCVEFGPNRTVPFAEEQMRALGLQRRIEVIAPTFAAVPWILPNSSRVAVLQERLAQKFARHLPLAIAPLPFPMSTMEEMAQFHSTRDRDAGLQWLLSRLQEKAQES